MKNNIVVGVDGTESAARALQWAVAEGKQRSLPVVAVLAWGWFDQHHAVIAPDFDPAYGEATARTSLKTYVHEALSEDAANAVEQVVLNDTPVPALVQASEDAAMLVLGARSLGEIKGFLLGSVTSQCLSHARCPVAVIHDDWQPEPAHDPMRVVVGVDGSSGSQAALSFAREAAKASDAQLELVHAWHIPAMFGLPFTGVPFNQSSIEKAAHHVMADAYDQITADGSLRPPTTAVVQGDASLALLDQAKGADLIVVGSRGMGGFKGLLLGSVSRFVSNEAQCPVVVVPERSQS